MVSPIFTMSHERNFTSTHATPQDSIANIAATDLERVTIESNLFPNNGLEEWTNPHTPRTLQTSRSIEKDTWWEHSVIYEGSTSYGLEARALDVFHYSEISLTNQSQVYWNNPTNLTLDFQWYLDSIGNSVNQDYFRIQITMDTRTMYYYMGCENTVSTNSSNSGYFNIGGATKTWNHFQRNLTSDYFETFGLLPTQYRTMYWFIRSYTTTYTRAYIDYIFMINGTTTKISDSVSGGDFEGGGAWTASTGAGAGDVAQCADSHEGSYSMNLTTLTFDDNAYAYASYEPRKLLSIDNQGNLSFWWNLDNYTNPTTNTYARVVVSFQNATLFGGNIYYYLFVGGSGMLPLVVMGNDLTFAVADFNVTDTWNFFDRNIWEDVTTYYPTENLWIEKIEFQVRNSADDARLSLLVDDITFNQSILSDMDYEHQNDVGERIQGWNSPPGSHEFTVTDYALHGSKAANLTLAENSAYIDQNLCQLQLDATTKLMLDFNVYIDTFNSSSEDYILFNFELNDESFAYVIANSTSNFEDEIATEEAAKFVLLQESLVIGEWLNFKLDLVHDYERLFGSLPDTTISYIVLMAEAGIASELTVIFDDLYIYYDAEEAPDTVAPVISLLPANGSTVSDIVSIEFNVTDAGSGFAWSQLFIAGAAITNTTLESVGISWDTNVIPNGEYNITVVASDNAGNIGTVTHLVTVENLGAPVDLSGVILIAVIIVAIAAVLIIYIFVIKKK